MARLLGIGAAHLVRQAIVDGGFEVGSVHAGSLDEQVDGTPFRALRVAALLGADAALLSLRGGDSAGTAVAEAIAQAGIEDLSVTFLTRASPSRLVLLDSAGAFVGAVVDEALYRRRFASQIMRRAFRDQTVAADALLVDESVGEVAFTRILKVAKSRPVHAVAGSQAALSALATVAAELTSLTLALGSGTDAAQTSAQLRSAGLASAVLVGQRSVLGYAGDAAFSVTLSGDEVELRSEAAEIAGAILVARLAGKPFGEALRDGVAAAFLMQKAAPVDPARLSQMLANVPEAKPQVIGVR